MGQSAKSHKLRVAKTARYFQLGEISSETQHIWLVLHGYGQLAEYFIRHFKVLENPNTVVVAPEGLSRFYLDGTFGRVGASWMTKVDRLDEIEDQIQYLDQLHLQLINLAPPHTKINLLGFSQGVATAWRWMTKSEATPDNFVLWAGSIPSQNPQSWIERFRTMGFYAALGDQDQFITPEKAIVYKEKLLEIHPQMAYFSFEGDHRIDVPTLTKINHKILGR